ncbi:MAG: tetratricopeptide repeat protein [Fusobacteriales bacterium]|jgi:tetratricopeptide (TPR) repeat protein|nr:tetratricopeptide repeat protein [Fusobacteriales bacterium]
MKRRIATVLLIILASISIVGEQTAPAGGETPAAGGGANPQSGNGAKPESQAKTENEIDQIIQSELNNINNTDTAETTTTTADSAVDTGTTPTIGGDEASDGSKFKVYDNYEKAIKTNPSSGAIFRLCNLYFRDGLYERAMNLAKQDNARDIRNLYVVALSSRLMGNFDQSVQYYNEILARYPNFLEAHLGLGIAYKSKRDFKRAVEYLKTYNNSRRDENVNREIVLLNNIINGTLN